MFKENGRQKPADKQEIANLKEWLYICKSCDMHFGLSSKVFGETKRCEVCGGELVVAPMDGDLH